MNSLEALFEQIKGNLPAYLAELGVKTGEAGKINCINPAHKDKTPSMGFIPDNNNTLIHCFGCGITYNIFDIANIFEGKAARGAGLLQETVPYLCNKFGILFDPASLAISPEAAEMFEYRELYTLVSRVFTELATYEHTDKRGWDKEFCKEHGIGTVKWQVFRDTICKMIGQDVEYLLARDINKDIFDEDKITYVIRDRYGRVCSFAGRNLKFTNGNKDIPKFKNTSSKVPISLNGGTLYGIHVACKSNQERIDVFEGYGDWIAAQQAGHKTCVAICGTSLSNDQIEILRKVGYTHINLVFDDDAAGVTKACSYLSNSSVFNGVKLTVTFLPFDKDQPDGKRDPEDFIAQYGIKAFLGVVPTTAFDWKLKTLLDKGIAKKEIASQLTKLISTEPSAIERGYMCVKLSTSTDIPESDIKDEVSKRSNSSVKDAADFLIGRLKKATDSIEIAQAFELTHERIKAATVTKDKAPFHISESSNHLDKWFKEVSNPKEDDTGWRTGWRSFDDPMMIAGIPKKDSIITFAGPPNHGKSAIIVNIAKNLILPEHNNKNLSVIYWSLDDPRNVTWSKIMASMMGVPILDVKRPDRVIYKDETLKARYNDWYAFMADQVANHRLIVKGHEIGNDLAGMEDFIRQVQDKTGNRVLLIVDAVNDMSTGFADYDSDERRKLIKCFDWFQRTTEMLEYSAITICHVTKSAIKQGKPDIADISETNKILFASKIIGMVYSELDYFTQRDVRDKSSKFWVDPTNNVHPDKKQPIIELAIMKSKESSFKGSLWFCHKSEACWLRELHHDDFKELEASNRAQMEAVTERDALDDVDDFSTPPPPSDEKHVFRINRAGQST